VFKNKKQPKIKWNHFKCNSAQPTTIIESRWRDDFEPSLSTAWVLESSNGCAKESELGNQQPEQRVSTANPTAWWVTSESARTDRVYALADWRALEASAQLDVGQGRATLNLVRQLSWRRRHQQQILRIRTLRRWVLVRRRKVDSQAVYRRPNSRIRAWVRVDQLVRSHDDTRPQPNDYW
jgi:hypothetical protein